MYQHSSYLRLTLFALSTFSEGTVGFTASSVMPRTALAASVARRMPTRALSSSLKSASLSQDVRVEELSAVPKRENHLLNRLGNPRFVAAPMVGQSDLAFRLLCRHHGTELCYTQMIHSKNFLSVAKHRKESWDPLAESLAISGVPLPTWLNGQDSSGYATAEGPLIAQFCGDDPSKVSAAARYVIENGVDGVDLNLGCPQAIARKGHYGAYLLREPELVQKIVSGMVQELQGTPVTVKIRVLESGPEATVEFAKMLEACGASAVCVHGRTVHQNKQLCGASNGDVARQVNAALSIPVIANGGISSAADALALLQSTGCAAVMSSEALLENPALFSPHSVAAAAAAAAAGGGSGGNAHLGANEVVTDSALAVAMEAQRVTAQQLAFAREYLELSVCVPPAMDGTHKALYGSTLKAHFFKFLHQIFTAHPELRDILLRANSPSDIESLLDTIAVRYALPTIEEAPLPDMLRNAHLESKWQTKLMDLVAHRSGDDARQSVVLGERSWYRRNWRLFGDKSTSTE